MNENQRGGLLGSSFLSSKQFLLGAIFLAVFLTVCLWTPTSHALQTVPYKMNFQGRLTDSSGNPEPDGLYNMKFRIYDAASGGTLQWNETRDTTYRVQVTGGLFSTQLGDASGGLPPGIFTNQNLYFEIELPSPATATCSTSGCATYSEGPMTPRSKLGTSAYAFNADQIDGIDSSSLARLDTANTFSSTSTFSGALTVNAASTFNGNISVTGSNTLSVQNSITVADAGSTGTVVLGVNGITLTGNARKAQRITLSPEYPGATFTGDGTNNTGSLSSDFCSSSSLLNVNATGCASAADEHNYYAWTTTQASAQDYDLYVRYKIPSDYDTGSLSNLKLWGWGTTTASEVVSLSLYKGSSAACGTITNAVTTNAAWSQATLASPLGSCSIVANDIVTLKVHLVAGANNVARTGEITFDYLARF